MTEKELKYLEWLMERATPGPWRAYLFSEDGKGHPLNDVVGGFVFRHSSPCGPMSFDKGGPVAPDNGVMIAGKREINRGYYPETGDSHMPEDVPLKPGDALFIAACRELVPKLVAEVRELRTRLMVELTGMSREQVDGAEALLRKIQGEEPRKNGGG